MADANIQIARTGSLGIAIETGPGVTNATAAIYLNYMDNTLRGHHTPIENISARTSRIVDSDSVVGKRWAQGDVKVLGDIKACGYLFKLALGNELYTAGTPSVHTFYPTVSGNTPLTATLINARGSTDIEQYSYAAVDSLDIEVTEGLMTVNAAFMAQYPVTGAAQTVTTTSGSVLAFKDYFVQFGIDLASAATAVATPLSEFKMKIANNTETIFRSGSSTLSAIRSKGLKVTGDYKLFFDSVTERDVYYNSNKRAMIITASGIGTENLIIRVAKFGIREANIATGIDEFYALTADWVAEDDVDTQGTRFMSLTLSNDKTSVY